MSFFAQISRVFRGLFARWDRLSLGARAIGLAWATFFLLQLHTPLFFLRDDNLSAWLPQLAAISRQLMAGQSPLLNPHLFSGNFRLLADPNCLFYFNPLTILLAPLGATSPGGGLSVLWLADIHAFCHLTVCIWASARLFATLRSKYALALPDGALLFLAWSFTFSGYNLIVGASWLTFLASAASWPLLFWGLWHPARRRGIALAVGAFVYALLFGHLHPFFFTLLFAGFFAVLLALFERDREPLLRLGVGLGLSLVLLSPLLWLFAREFAASPRAGALSLAEASEFSLGPLPLLTSFWLATPGQTVLQALGLYSYQLVNISASCCASWLVWSGAKNRWSLPLNRLCLVMAALSVLFIARPDWLGVWLNHTPVFRSLRWPSREILVLLFFVHLYLALLPKPLPARVWRLGALGGIFVILLSFLVEPRRSFADFNRDRELLVSGRAARFWESVRPRLQPQTRLIAIMDKHQLRAQPAPPFVLLGAFNYPSLFGVPSASGYVATGVRGLEAEAKPLFHGGVFSSQTGQKLLEKHPSWRAIRLKSAQPLQLEWWSANSREPLPVPP